MFGDLARVTCRCPSIGVSYWARATLQVDMYVAVVVGGSPKSIPHALENSKCGVVWIRPYRVPRAAACINHARRRVLVGFNVVLGMTRHGDIATLRYWARVPQKRSFLKTVPGPAISPRCSHSFVRFRPSRFLDISINFFLVFTGTPRFQGAMETCTVKNNKTMMCRALKLLCRTPCVITRRFDDRESVQGTFPTMICREEEEGRRGEQ